MPDAEEADCEPSKRKKIPWTSNAWLNSLGQPTCFSFTHGFNKEQVQKDWASYHCQYLGHGLSVRTWRNSATRGARAKTSLTDSVIICTAVSNMPVPRTALAYTIAY